MAKKIFYQIQGSNKAKDDSSEKNRQKKFKNIVHKMF